MTKEKKPCISYPSSEKIYIIGEINKINVGMRRIKLSSTTSINRRGERIVKKNNPVIVYDTTGVFSDSTYLPKAEGIARIKDAWPIRRKDWLLQSNGRFVAKEKKNISQMYYAKRRIITPEMEYVAIRENQQMETLGLKSYITPDFVRKEIAAGRAVIPSNINHPEAEPMIIGRSFLVKVNAMLAYEKKANAKDEVERIAWNCKWGSDMLTEASCFSNISQTRETVLRNSPIPLCTTPLLQAFERVGRKIELLSWETFRDTLVEHAEQGVDCVIIHAAMLKQYLKLIDSRLTGITSNAGLIIQEWMTHHGKENFLHTHFDEICGILKQYDVTLSLGSALQSGSIYDANDTAQISELKTMGELVQMARKDFIQVIVEGYGHIPMNKIQENIKEQQYRCANTPFHAIGPTVTDITLGHCYVASAIGASFGAWMGAAIISGQDISIADDDEVKSHLLAMKTAAHAADIAKGHPGSKIRDNAISKAQYEKRWKDVCNLSFDPKKTAKQIRGL